MALFITHVIENEYHRIELTNYGASILRWNVKKKHNRNIVLTYEHNSDYINNNTGYLGATIGRYANRIKEGVFTLDGKKYQLAKNYDNNVNAGHGGDLGFSARYFSVFEKQISGMPSEITFKYVSVDGEEGYPGEVDLSVTYKLEGETLVIKYEATTNAPTIINITNHSYFNLDGSNSVLNHALNFKSQYFLEVNKLNQVTGKKVKIPEDLDLSNGVTINKLMENGLFNSKPQMGLDHCFNLDDQKLMLIGKDLTLIMKTSYPAVQLYATNFPANKKIEGGGYIQKHHALAIEPGFFADQINSDQRDKVILRQGETYKHFIQYIVR